MDLYLDCFSGISGDMTLGAFVDLGVPVDFLKTELARMPLNNFDISESTVFKHGIRATHVRVHDHHHDHHGHTHHGDHPHPMDYRKIKHTIQTAPLSDSVKAMGLGMFEKIADAESTIHGCDKDHVHFHEVGGIDAMVDMVGAALCVEYLGIKHIRASTIPLGSGFTTCAHGTLPVPAPATAEILKGIPVTGSAIKQELVTPTGAAIIATLAKDFGELPPMVIEKTGYGAGTRDNELQPNLLRMISGTFDQTQTAQTIIIMECTIDDMNPEHFGYVMDRLLEDGALDVTLQPVFMKKNRPGTLLSVICTHADRKSLTRCILSETSTTGLRYYPARREILERKIISVKTRFGDIMAKQIIRPDGSLHITPEYEACRIEAKKRRVPIQQVYESVIVASAEKNGD